MADPNFPQRPQYGWQPQGGLGGMLYARDRSRYENMAGLEDVLTQARTGAEMERMPFETDIKRQEARTMGLANQFTEATQPGKIGATNAQSQTSIGAEQLEQMHQALTVLDTLSQVGPSPVAPQQMGQIVQSIPGAAQNPVVREALSRIRDPKQIPQAAMALRNYLQQYRQAMDTTRLQGEYGLKRQGLANEGAIRAAQVNAKGKVKSVIEEIQEAKGPVEIVTKAAALYELPGVAPELKEWAGRLIEKNWEAYQIELRKSQIQINHPSLTPTPMQQQFTGGGTSRTPPPGAMPIDQARVWLNQSGNNTPENRKFFEETYGTKP